MSQRYLGFQTEEQ